MADHKIQMPLPLNPTTRIEVVILAGAVFILTFAWSDRTLDPVLHPRFLLLSLTAVILSVLILLKRNEYSRHLSAALLNPVTVMLVIYAVVAGFSFIQAHNRAEAIFELSKICLWLVLLMQAVVILSADRRNLLILATVMTFAAIVHGIIGVFQYFDWGFSWIPGNYIIHGIMPSRNHFSAFLLLTLPFALVTAVLSRGWLRKIGWISVALTLYTLVLTTTRAALIGVIAGGAVVGALYISSLRQEKKRFWITIWIILLCLSAVTIAAILTGKIHIRTGDDGRLLLWMKTLRMIGDHPFSGVGIGNWKFIIPLYGIEDVTWQAATGIVHFQRPHNDFLWTASETGIFGMTAYCLVFAFAGWMCLTTWKKSEYSDERLTALAMLFGMIAYLSIAIFAYPRERITLTVLMTLILAITISLSTRVRKPVSGNRSKSNLAVLIICLIFSLQAVLIGMTRLKGEIHVKNALAARAEDRRDDVITEIDRAYSRLYTVDPTAAPLKWYSGVAHFSCGRYREARRDFEDALRAHPNHIYVLHNLGTCAEKLGDHETAIKMYRKTLEIAPHFDEALANLSIVYYNLGEYDTALSFILRCNQESLGDKLIKYRENLRRITNDETD